MIYAFKNKGASFDKHYPDDKIENSRPPKVKDNEWYTGLQDIRDELVHYKDHFVGAKVYCNCDDYSESGFFDFFNLAFNELRLKELTTCSISNKASITTFDGLKKLKIKNGSFASAESIKLLRDCDVVVTNPPFSEFSEFLELLDEHKKKFLIMGDLRSIGGNEAKRMLLNGEMWLGQTRKATTWFERPDGSSKPKGLVRWFTNLTYSAEIPTLELECRYDPVKYPKIKDRNGELDIINVDFVKQIPKDYDKKMAVPITFMDYAWKDFRMVDVIGDATVIYKGMEKKRQRVIIQRIQ